MPLTTKCRHCGRLFPVYAQQLKKGRGKVECPQCGKRFNALAGLMEETIPVSGNRKRGKASGGNRRALAPTSPAPMLVLDEPRRARRLNGSGLWMLGVLLLTAFLIAQAAWWDRESWLSRPGLYAGAETICARLGCEVPLPSAPDDVEVLQPIMMEHPEDARILRLSLTLINRAAFPQRFPLLQLELYDEAEKLTAARRFTPGQYLAEAARRALGPGAAANLMLDLAMPEPPPAGFRVRVY